jgi:hypothetical protein
MQEIKELCFSEMLTHTRLYLPKTYVVCATKAEKVNSEFTHPFLAPPVFLSASVFVAKGMPRGNSAVFMAHHEKSTARFNPILEGKSNSVDRLASTTVLASVGTPTNPTRSSECN